MMIRILSIMLCLSLCVSLALAQDEFEVETYTSEDGSITFDYPTDWSLSEQDGNYALSSPNDEAPIAYIQWGEPHSLLYYRTHNTSSTPLEFAQFHVGDVQLAVIHDLPIEPDEITSNQIVVFNIEGRQAAYYVFQEAEGEWTYANFVVDLGGYLAPIQIVCPEGGNACIFAHQADFFLIVKSLRYTPPEPVFSGDDELPNVLSLEITSLRRFPGELTFFYPDDWYAVNDNTNVTVLQSTDQYISPFEMQTGEMTVTIFDPEYNARTLTFGQLNLVDCEDDSEVVNLLTVLQEQYLLVSAETAHPHEFGNYEGLSYSYVDDFQRDVLLLSVDTSGTNIISVAAYAPSGEMSLYEDTLMAIAATFDYKAGECSR